MSSLIPICSVCIANYNGIEVLQECIDSVRNQDCDFPVEIIIHDDASTDESVSFIQQHYPEAVLIESQQNVGFCIANNRMVEKARGQFVLLLNNDAALLPDALATLMREAQQLREPAILGLPQYDAETNELLDIGSLLDPFFNPVPNKDPNRREVGMIMGACLWIPIILWKELAGFPEWFGSIGEDLYLCCRARLAGYSVIALGDSGYHHRVGRSFGGGKVKKNKLVTTIGRRALTERNKTYVLVICYPTLLLILILPLHLMLLLLEGCMLSLLRWNTILWRKIYAPIFLDLWRNWSMLFLFRKKIQRNCNISQKNWLSVFHLWPYKLKMLLKYGVPVVH